MLITVALVLVLAMAACETAAPTLAPTPTPTPTSTPAPDPIVNLSEDATFHDFLELLPAEALRCLVDRVGQSKYEQLLGQPVFGDHVAFGAELPLECFNQDTVVSLVIAELSQAAGGLTDATVTCVRETFGGLDVASLAAITSGDISGGALSDSLGVGIGLLLCLNDDEASRITAGGIFGDVGEASDISLADLRCVLQAVDIAQLIGMMESLDSGTALDLSDSLVLLTAFSDCGISIPDLAGGVPDGTHGGGMEGGTTDWTAGGTPVSAFDLSDLSQLPSETQAMIQCLVNAIGEDHVSGFLTGAYTPTLDDFAALGTCNVDLTQLSELSALLGG
jgi:hypothetical protein